MENQIKFTDEELQNIKSIQDDNTQLIMESGQLELELYSLNTRLKVAGLFGYLITWENQDHYLKK